jgi:hypothetical protein
VEVIKIEDIQVRVMDEQRRQFLMSSCHDGTDDAITGNPRKI